MIHDIFDTPPQAINEQGVKFWVDEALTRYARNRGINAQVLLAEHPDRARSRLLVQDGRAVAEDQTLEGMAAKIDFMALDAQLK